MRKAGIEPEMVSSGSTPTFALSIDDPNIEIYHPGNYVFNDCIQMSNGSATEDDCALTVLATVISHPSEGLYICDAGAKCLGLDQGAHGNSAIIGFGRSGCDIHGRFLRSAENDICNVKYVVEADPARAAAAREIFGCETMEDYRELYDHVEELDFVTNTSYSDLHYPITKDLMEHGFHVLCEKHKIRFRKGHVLNGRS